MHSSIELDPNKLFTLAGCCGVEPFCFCGVGKVSSAVLGALDVVLGVSDSFAMILGFGARCFFVGECW
jgi:hypothetical protein